MRETATRKASECPANAKGEIVVYQPDETMRLEVRLDGETVWLTQAQIAELFGTRRPAVTKHLVNIYRDGELDEKSTCSILEHMSGDGSRVYATKHYNLAYERFRQQYPDDALCLVPWDKAHDRFIVCDDTAWLCGASVKDAGRRMFALVRMATSPDFILKDLPTPKEDGRRSGGVKNGRGTLV